MTTVQLVRSRRVELLRIAARHGARDVRVFGSVARGDSDDASDIDFLVEMEPGRSLLDLGGLQADLESLLGLHVDVVTVGGLKARIRSDVLAEAVPL
ncbi:MAG: nucleotidyltransferase family protein [Chloroflexota bacterium]